MSNNQKPSARRKAAAPVVEDVTLAMPHVREALAAIDDPTTATKAWGTLYGVAAAYLREGKAPPPRIAHLMAERLDAVSSVLSGGAKDVREMLPDAVLTETRAKSGRPAKNTIHWVVDELLISAFEKAFPQSLQPFLGLLYEGLPREEMLRFAATITSNEQIENEATDWAIKKFVTNDTGGPYNEETLIEKTKKRCAALKKTKV